MNQTVQEIQAIDGTPLQKTGDIGIAALAVLPPALYSWDLAR